MQLNDLQVKRPIVEDCFPTKALFSEKNHFCSFSSLAFCNTFWINGALFVV